MLALRQGRHGGTRLAMTSIFVVVPFLLAAAPVTAEDSPGVAIRAGNHTGFGRIVFDVAPAHVINSTATATRLPSHSPTRPHF